MCESELTETYLRGQLEGMGIVKNHFRKIAEEHFGQHRDVEAKLVRHLLGKISLLEAEVESMIAAETAGKKG